MPEPLLARIPPADMPEDLRSAWSQSMELRGDATFFEVFANHPELYRWYISSFYEEVFRGGRVPRRYKELLRLRLSTLHGCKFCNQGNREDARAAGLSEAEINALEDPDSDALSAQDRAVLALGERLSLVTDHGAVDAELHARLANFFDDAQILELGFVGSVLSGVAKFLFSFDLVEREENCPFHPAA